MSLIKSLIKRIKLKYLWSAGDEFLSDKYNIEMNRTNQRFRKMENTYKSLFKFDK